MAEERREVTETEGLGEAAPAQESFIEICLAIATKALVRHTPPEK